MELRNLGNETGGFSCVPDFQIKLCFSQCERARQQGQAVENRKRMNRMAGQSLAITARLGARANSTSGSWPADSKSPWAVSNCAGASHNFPGAAPNLTGEDAMNAGKGSNIAGGSSKVSGGHPNIPGANSKNTGEIAKFVGGVLQTAAGVAQKAGGRSKRSAEVSECPTTGTEQEAAGTEGWLATKRRRAGLPFT